MASSGTGARLNIGTHDRSTVVRKFMSRIGESRIGSQSANLVRSRQRVADHGEVFTPKWMVEAMLDLVKGDSERIDARFLEPACGSGNFLASVLRRKLDSVQVLYEKSGFEKQHHALLAGMSVYGIELLADNAAECRDNLLEVVTEFTDCLLDDPIIRAFRAVLGVNIVHGDALTMTANDGQPIVFAEWGYLGRGKYQRRDFVYSTLTQMSSWGDETLFGDIGEHEIFTPCRTYRPMSIEEIGL